MKDERGSRGATLVPRKAGLLIQVRAFADTLRCDNGAPPVRASISVESSPARLTGPFGAHRCTAFTPSGGSLNMVAARTLPGHGLAIELRTW